MRSKSLGRVLKDPAPALSVRKRDSVRSRSHCLVPTCKPHRLGADNRTYVLLPKDKEIRKAWFKAIKVKDINITRRHRVCSLHFESSDFERDLMNELLGLDRRKKLKPTVVPWLFLPGDDYAEQTISEGNDLSKSSEDGGGVDTTEGIEIDDSHALETESTPSTSTSGKGKRVRVRTAKAIELQPEIIAPPPPPPPLVGCLLCCKHPVIKDYSDKYQLPGSNSFEPLNKQLWHIFTLEKILGIPSSKCKSLIEKYGKAYHPSGWFHLCVTCSGVVAKIMTVYGQFISLELQMKTLKNKLVRKVKTSLKSCSDKNLEQNEVEVEIRDVLREINDIPPLIRVQIKTESVPVEDNDNEYDCVVAPEVESEPEVVITASTGVTPRQSLADRIDNLMKLNNSALSNSAVKYCRAKDKYDRPSLKVPNATATTSSTPVIPIPAFYLVPVPDPAKTSSPQKIPSIARNILKKARAISQSKALPNRFKCDMCSAVFGSSEILSAHKSDHEKSVATANKFVCKLCGFPFHNESFLKNHLELQHRYYDSLESLADVQAPAILEQVPQEKQIKPPEQRQVSPSRTMVTEVQAGIESVVNTILTPPKLRRKQRKFVYKYTKCSRCNLTFTQMFYNEHLKQHEKSDKMDNQFDCPTCSFPYDNALSLERHRKKIHVEKQEKAKKKICEICGLLVSSNKTGWKAHMLKHKLEDGKMTDSGEFGCTLCDKSFPNKYKLVRHKRKDHALELGLTFFLCTHCGKTMSTEKLLTAHINKLHLNPKPEVEPDFTCDTCGKGFPDNKSLKDHRLEDHDGKCYVCDKCGGEYRTLSGLKDHQNKYYGDDKHSSTSLSTPEPGTSSISSRRRTGKGRRPVNKKPQECKHCDVKLPHFAALVHHLKSHAKFDCSQCSKKFMSRENVIKHQAVAHATGNTKATCRFCSKEFTHKNYVYSHYEFCKGITNSLYRVYCDNCKRGFRHKLGYNVHKHYCKKKVEAGETEPEKTT